jgi:hypothetical protein
VPASGTLTVAYEQPAWNVREARHEIAAALLDDAAERAVTIWADLTNW